MAAGECELCNAGGAILKNRLAYARPEHRPLGPGHMIVVPFRHVAGYFEMTLEEKQAVAELLDQAKSLLDREHAPDGYNIGVNIGEAAGQTRMHVHVHLIPRFKGDVENPGCGIRCVLAKKKG